MWYDHFVSKQPEQSNKHDRPKQLTNIGNPRIQASQNDNSMSSTQNTNNVDITSSAASEERQRLPNGPTRGEAESNMPASDTQRGKKRTRTEEETKEDLENRSWFLYINKRTQQPTIAKGGMMSFVGKYGLSKNGSR